MNDRELQRFLVEKAGVAHGSGGEFGRGGEGFVRLNAACPSATLQKALEQIRAAVDAL